MCGGQALPPQLGDLRRLARDKQAGTAFEAAVLVEGPGTRDPVRPRDRSATIAGRRDRNDHNAVDCPTPATGDPSSVRRHSPLSARNEPQVPHATAVRAAAVPAKLADKLSIGRLYRGGSLVTTRLASRRFENFRPWIRLTVSAPIAKKLQTLRISPTSKPAP
jgi:hypothetical protein